ncbi:MAG: cyclase family protein [Bacteroidota bacterium]
MNMSMNEDKIQPEKKFLSGQMIDITAYIKNGMVHWPGEPEVIVRRFKSISSGDMANVTSVSMSAHTATHADSPLHFINNAPDASLLDLTAFLGPARVIEVKNTTVVTSGELQNFHIDTGERILFRTHNSDRNWPEENFLPDYVYLSTEAARYLADKHIQTVGIDYLSVAGKENGEQVHKILLESGITIIEGLYMPYVSAGKYELISLPMKIHGSDGAPVRAILKPLNKSGD